VFRAEVRFVSLDAATSGKDGINVKSNAGLSYSEFLSRPVAAYFPQIDRISTAASLVKVRAPRASSIDPAAGAAEKT
jgi:hypothetical protein